MEILLTVAVFGGLLYLAYRQAKKKLDAFAALVAREGLTQTSTPCGLDDEALARLDVCPDEARRHGARFEVTGTERLQIGGEPVEVEVAAFEWWWEEQRHTSDSNTTTSVEVGHAIGAVRLPFRVPHVTLAPEGWLARRGVGGRADVQVESEEFNRRFDVQGHETDPQQLVQLLAPDFQQLLVEGFDGRSVELAGDVLLVAGTPTGGREAEPSLAGVVAELPGARRDAVRLAEALPTAFVRGVA